MTLKEYVNERGLASLAARLNVDISTVSRWANGIRIPHPDDAVRIEKATKGAVWRGEVFGWERAA